MNGMCVNGFFSGKAQNVFGHHVKRVCFDLNPFHERIVREEDDETYKPSSKFVPHLPSIVLCENPWDLNSEKTPQYMELNPDNFWRYLYSNSWGELCTLRVLEGELLELLLHCLYILERDHRVISCTHSAFVNNRRTVRPCMKTNQQKDENHINEILLIDLTYYCKRIKKKEYDFSSRIDYSYRHLLETLPESTDNETSSTSMQFHRQMGTYLEESQKHLSKLQDVLFPSQGPNPFQDSTNELDIDDKSLAESVRSRTILVPNVMKMQTDHRFKHSSLKPLTKRILMSAVKSAQTPKMGNDRSKTQKTSSKKKGVLPSATTGREKGKESSRTKSEVANTKKPDKKQTANQTSKSHPSAEVDKSESEEELRRHLSSYDLETLKYLLETSKSDEQFDYQKNVVMQKFLGTARDMLQRKMMNLILERESKEREYAAYKERMLKYHPKPKLIEDSGSSISIIRIFSKTPSFLDFVQWLEEEGCYDSKYKYSCRKKKDQLKKQDEKSQILIETVPISNSSSTSVDIERGDFTKEGNPSLIIKGTEGEVIEELSKQKRASIRHLDKKGSELVLKSEYLSCAQQSKSNDSSGTNNSKKGNTEEPTDDSHKVNKSNTHRFSEARRRSSAKSRKEASLISESSDSDGGKHRSEKGRRRSSAKHGKKNRRDAVDSDHSKSMSNKAKNRRDSKSRRRRKSGWDTEDSDDSEESEVLPGAVFDIHKINKGFSFENLAQRTKLTKATFHNTVTRYIGIQKAVKAFRACLKSKTPSPTQTPDSHLANKHQQPIKLEPIKRRSVLLNSEQMIVGTMRPFKFLQYSNHIPTCPRLAIPKFSVTTLEDCFTNLHKALDDFVIRKENITTDCGYKHVSSVTFTRPAVFNKFG